MSSVSRAQVSLPSHLVADLTDQDAAAAGSRGHGCMADAETRASASHDPLKQTVVSACSIQREALALTGATGLLHSSHCTSKGKRSGCLPVHDSYMQLSCMQAAFCCSRGPISTAGATALGQVTTLHHQEHAMQCLACMPCVR